LETSQRRALDRGLEPNAVRLRALAGELDATRVAAEALARWESEDARLGALQDAAARRLREALASRGAPPEPDFEVAHAAYVAACADRERLGALAGRRTDLESRLAAREAAERLAQEATSARDHARDQLRAAAARCSVGVEGEEGLVRELRRWQEHHQAERALQESLLTFHHRLKRPVREGLAFQESLMRFGGLLLKRLHRAQAVLHDAERIEQHDVAAFGLSGGLMRD